MLVVGTGILGDEELAEGNIVDGVLEAAELLVAERCIGFVHEAACLIPCLGGIGVASYEHNGCHDQGNEAD